MKEFLIRRTEKGWQNIKAWQQHTESLKPGAYKITISRTNRRSTPQNSYLWAVVYPAIRQAFYDLGHELSTDEVHEFLKGKFNSKSVTNEETGETVEVPMSTANLNKSDFSEYVERIQRFAAEFLGVTIPDPNTQLTIDNE